tara:strand:+ start:5082 stop:6347 length:1266 start_codon:yes stop_codon:yes gene_type:complete
MQSQSTNLYNQLAKKKLIQKKINFDLVRIKNALKKLGNPERKLTNPINIIGSDGKYSVLTYLKYFIEANGMKTSAFISPSLKSIRERFWMGEHYLTFSEIKKTLKTIDKLNVQLTLFEAITLIYIINAASKNNDFNLIEAGALFAKDSTNVFEFPLSQIIVNINKQHLNFLKKKTIDEVIKQKVGCLSNFTKIYINNQKPLILKKIKKILKKNKSEKTFSNNWKIKKIKSDYYYLDRKNKISLNLKNIRSKGLIENIGLAIKVALDIGINKKIITKTVPKIQLEARVQFVKRGKLVKNLFKSEKVLLDGCHSEISGKNFANYLKSLNLKKYGIIGMSENKNPEKFIKNFKGIFQKVIAVPIDNIDNSVKTNTLVEILKKNNFKNDTAKNINQAIMKLSSKEKKVICIFGSLYLCGNFLEKN